MASPSDDETATRPSTSPGAAPALTFKGASPLGEVADFSSNGIYFGGLSICAATSCAVALLVDEGTFRRTFDCHRLEIEGEKLCEAHR
jgi:hypothetical protein